MANHQAFPLFDCPCHESISLRGFDFILFLFPTAPHCATALHRIASYRTEPGRLVRNVMMSTQSKSGPAVGETRKRSRDEVISPQEVQDLILQGQSIVIYDEFVLRLDSWLDKHPGGRLAILHMVGKDATDEIVA